MDFVCTELRYCFVGTKHFYLNFILSTRDCFYCAKCSQWTPNYTVFDCFNLTEKWVILMKLSRNVLRIQNSHVTTITDRSPFLFVYLGIMYPDFCVKESSEKLELSSKTVGMTNEVFERTKYPSNVSGDQNQTSLDESVTIVKLNDTFVFKISVPIYSNTGFLFPQTTDLKCRPAITKRLIYPCCLFVFKVGILRIFIRIFMLNFNYITRTKVIRIFAKSNELIVCFLLLLNNMA